MFFFTTARFFSHWAPAPPHANPQHAHNTHLLQFKINSSKVFLYLGLSINSFSYVSGWAFTSLSFGCSLLFFNKNSLFVSSISSRCPFVHITLAFTFQAAAFGSMSKVPTFMPASLLKLARLLYICRCLPLLCYILILSPLFLGLGLSLI